MIRGRGNLISAVQTKVTSVKNWDRSLEVTDESYTQHKLPLAGFYVIEAENLDEVIELVSNTPCARAEGVIEILPFSDSSAG
ncbi:YciI family protein [Virgibacillus oceani]